MMTPGDRYKAALVAVGLNQTTAAELFETTVRTQNRWAQEGPPPHIAVLVHLMQTVPVTIAEIEKIKATQP